jgi:CRP-like cAMP-binding protein
VRFTADLSPTLRKEILLHMNRDCVLNCDFFRDVSNECIIRLVHSFKFAVFLAHDVLAEEGEMASELVFVIHGSAKVTKLGRIMPVSLLSPGDYFGEKSLLMHHRNAVSVVATENCDTRVLEKMDFEDLTIDYPELRESIMKRSDHMDVTEYDSHTKRQSMMIRQRTSGKHGLSLASLETEVLKLKPEPAKVVSPSHGSFSFEPSPAGGSDAGGGGGDLGNSRPSSRSSRPFTAGSKARITEMFATVKVMNDSVETLQKQQKRLEAYLGTVDSKLDKLLVRMSDPYSAPDPEPIRPARGQTGISL